MEKFEIPEKTIFEWVAKFDGWKAFEICSMSVYLFWVSDVINDYVQFSITDNVLDSILD